MSAHARASASSMAPFTDKLQGSELRFFLSKQKQSNEHKLAKIIGKDASLLQHRMGLILVNPLFEIVMNLVIVSSIATVVYECDAKAQASRGVDNSTGLKIAAAFGYLFTVVYVFEMSSRLFVWRRKFWFDGMNVFDFVVVAIDVVTSFIGEVPSASILRIIRLVKLARAFRAFNNIKELYVIISGLVDAFRAIIFGSVVVFVLLLFWSILAVEVLRPMVNDLAADGRFGDCERCGRAFDGVFASMLTFVQQIIAGDSWGQISLPLIDAYPGAAPIVIAALVSINCGVLNLLLSAIVESATLRRESDQEHLAKAKNDEFALAKGHLLAMCRQMDKDNSGEISEHELRHGYVSSPDFFDIMHRYDIEQEEMGALFRALDRDASGAVSINEFVEELHKMGTQDAQSALIYLKCHVRNVEAMLHEQHQAFTACLDDLHKSVSFRLESRAEKSDQAAVPCVLEPAASSCVEAKSRQSQLVLGAAVDFVELESISLALERLRTLAASRCQGLPAQCPSIREEWPVQLPETNPIPKSFKEFAGCNGR